MYFSNIHQHLSSNIHATKVSSQSELAAYQEALLLLKPLSKSRRSASAETMNPKGSALQTEAEEDTPPAVDFARRQTSNADSLEGFEEWDFEEKEARFKLKFTNFLLQYNLSFSVAESLMAFLHDLLSLFNVVDLLEFRIDRKSVSRIVSGFMGPLLQTRYFDALKRSPFSLSIDEGTALGAKSYLAINAKYLEHDEATFTTTKLIGLLKMGTSSTGDTLFKMLDSFLFFGERGKLRKRNFLGIAADHASNMIH